MASKAHRKRIHENKIDKYPVPAVCPYCGAAVVLTGNATIYGRPYGNGQAYVCTRFREGCRAYVGVHDGTTIPLGRMADDELRSLRKACHALFDPLWMDKAAVRYDKRARERMYNRLAGLLGIKRNECHFGHFDNETARRALKTLQMQGWWTMKGAGECAK